MPSFSYDFTSHGTFKGKSTFETGLYINGKFEEGSAKTIDVINPSTGETVGKVTEGTPEGESRRRSSFRRGRLLLNPPFFTLLDVDRAVEAAQKCFDTKWGSKYRTLVSFSFGPRLIVHTPRSPENLSGTARGKILIKIAELIEDNVDELASLESLDNGKAFSIAKGFDIVEGAATFRYYAGWADKDHGKVIDVNPSKMAYTVHDPIGVVGQIIPWVSSRWSGRVWWSPEKLRVC
jgi:aldehyde dehydrogenase (NAD+)